MSATDLMQALATGDEICGTPEECLAAAAGIFTTVVADFGEEVPVWGEVHQATFPHPVLEQLNLQVPNRCDPREQWYQTYRNDSKDWVA